MKFNIQTTAKAAAIVTAAVIVIKAVKAGIAKFKAKTVTTDDIVEASLTPEKIFPGDKPRDANGYKDCCCDCECAATDDMGCAG